MLDVITIGSATMDVFVECDTASVVSIREKNRSQEYMCYPYGSKLEITDFDSQVGGGGVNTAINFANLGMKTGAIFKIGNDIYAKGILDNFKDKNVDLSNIIQKKSVSTGFSIILTSFEGDRTVLAHRGANITLKPEDIDFDKLKKTKWIYCAPLNSKYGNVLEKITDFAEENNIKIAHNIGGKALDKSFDELKPILQKLNILSLNTEEATRITKIEQKYTKNKKQIINGRFFNETCNNR